MGEGVTKDGDIILHQIYRFRVSVHSWGSRVHQTKSRYYLGPFQKSRAELFVEIVFGYKL